MDGTIDGVIRFSARQVTGQQSRTFFCFGLRSEYDPIERGWSSLQQKWNGVLLTCWEVVQECVKSKSQVGT
jgi:hypothetical protein